MVTVRLLKDKKEFVETHPNAVYVQTDENWLTLIDLEGLTVAVYPKEIVVGARIKAGENDMTSADPNKT